MGISGPDLRAGGFINVRRAVDVWFANVQPNHINAARTDFRDIFADPERIFGPHGGDTGGKE